MSNSLYRLWRIPMRYALLLALPMQLVMLWVAHLGWVQFDRNRHFGNAAANPPFDLEQLRYFTKNELDRSIARTLAPDPTEAKGLESIELTIDRRHVASLNANLPDSGRTTYYPAVLTVDGHEYPIKTRYMGDNHWHWLYPQKSWKVRTKKGDPIRDRATFNLKNPPTVATFEDVIANELAKEIGVISPEIAPVRLFVNGAYSGVHLWWDVADESLLRRYQRMPGSIYSGDGAPAGRDGVGSLFQRVDLWEKASARNAEQAADRADIESLIAAINTADEPTFRAYFEEHFDLGRYASFVALDRLLGGQHHDYNHNHKLYFDPYRGRFEPIEWDFAYWMMHYRQPGLDVTTNPLLTRVRQHPELELRIQRALYDLVQRVTPERMRERMTGAADKVRPALASDGFRDARDNLGTNQLRLATLNSAYFSIGDFDRKVEQMLQSFGWRHSWLKGRLDNSSLLARTDVNEAGGAVVTLQSEGLVGQHLSRIDVTAEGGRVELIRDLDCDGTLDPDEQPFASAPIENGIARITVDELILPALQKETRPREWTMLYGLFQLSPAPLRYTYFVRVPDGRVRSVAFAAKNAVTGAAVAARTDAEMQPLAAQSITFHPWLMPRAPSPHTVELGPGEVTILESRAYGPEVTLVVNPGTTLRLGPGVSLEMRGKVLAIGTAEAPIRVLPAEADKPWGVFALHGMGTKGSRFAHCRWEDGSTDKLRMVLRTGMVSFIDSADLAMRDCFIGRNHVGDDALHWGYIEGGEIRDCEFRGARSDAFDIDISHDLKIVGCRFFNSGNDSVDLMTSAVEIVDCQFLDAGDKGTSVGEGSDLMLVKSRFERCVTGIEIKDGSVAKVDGETRFLECQTGINLYRKNPRYSRGGTLQADHLWIHACKAIVTADKRSTVKVGTLHEEAPAN